MGHHVHGSDAQHRAVHVEAIEHMVHVVLFLLAAEEYLLLAPLLEILSGGYKEARGAAGRVTDHVVSLRVGELHHHADYVARRAELAVHARRGDLGKEVLVYVAAHVGAVGLLHLGIYLVHRRDDLLEHERRGDLEDGIAHVLGIGAVLIRMQPFDEREHLFLHHGVHFPCREVVKPRPFELFPSHHALSNAHFACEDTLVRQAEHGALLGAEVVRLVQVVDEHQIGHLFHHVQRIRYAAGPEGLPEAVYFVSKFAGQHIILSPCSKYRRCSARR